MPCLVVINIYICEVFSNPRSELIPYPNQILTNLGLFSFYFIFGGRGVRLGYFRARWGCLEKGEYIVAKKKKKKKKKLNAASTIHIFS